MNYAAVTIIGAGLMFGAAPANADDTSVLNNIEKPAAGPGIDTAKDVAPTWCAVVKPKEYTPRGLERLFGNRIGVDGYGEAAQIMCQWPNDAGTARAVGALVQRYMNNAGITQARAMELLALRAQPEKFAADHDVLCKALAASGEDSGEESHFAKAREALFGCSSSGPAWIRNRAGDNDELRPFMDSSAQEPDLIVRTAYAITSTGFVFSSNKRDDEDFLSYITDQFDLKGISEAAALKMLEQAPYKGNTYARVVLLESVADAQLATTKLEQEVAKRITDDAWKQLLVTAPRAAAEAYEKSAAPWKDQLARSVAFEKKFWGPSKKAMQGCWAPLKKDFIDVMKTMKHANANEAYESLNEPVPALLFQRLVACAAVDKDAAFAERLNGLAGKVRYSRGPRSAAYFAGLSALKEILDDRRNFPIELWKMSKKQPKNHLLENLFRRYTKDSKLGVIGYGGSDEHGTVKSVKKGDDGVVITFVTTKTQIMTTSCEHTNRIVMFDHDAKPIYYQKCKETGLATVTTNPDPVVVDPELAEGIKPGMVVEMAVGHPTNRYAFPITVYTDKKKTKLVSYYGFVF